MYVFLTGTFRGMMLKKCIAILTLFVYLPAMAGVGFSTHFCGGQANATKIFSFSKEHCCSDDPAEDACCSDQVTIVKLDKDQCANAHKPGVKPTGALVCVIPAGKKIRAINETGQKPKSFVGESPPLVSKNLLLIYCCLLI